jgi:IclR family transcriptional regulator, KDG regulon repressor
MVMPGVQSVERVFNLLRAVGTRPAGISELARRVDLPVSTVARFLATLEAIGAVVRPDGVTYEIGPVISELAVAVDPAATLVARARPFLVELVEGVGETAGISIAEDREVRYLDHVEAANEIQVRDWTGVRLPLHVVSSGLVMLAYRPAAEIDAYLAAGLTRFTEHTTTRAAELRRRLTAIRADGYVWTAEEFHEGITSVAAPVFDSNRTVVAAIHCHGPSYRFPKPGEADVVASAVVAAAGHISALEPYERKSPGG